MFIWIALLASFVCGIVVLCKRKFNISRNRQVVGTHALLIGIGLLILPFIAVGFAFLIGIVGAAQNWHPDTVQNTMTACSLVLVVIPALVLAINLKRWSVPIKQLENMPDFDGLSIKASQPDFDFLETDDNQGT